MSGTEGKEQRRRARWPLAALAIIVTAGVVAWLAIARARPAVSWPTVLQAVGDQTTIHGTARIDLGDGTRWEYALWSRVKGPGRCETKGLAKRARPGPTESPLPEQPGAELMELCRAMDCCGEEGVVTRLAAQGSARMRGRWTEVGGKRAWEFDVETADLASAAHTEGYPEAWTIVVDPTTKLVQALDAFAVESGALKLRARCEYQYGRPLPDGFDQAPG